MNLKLSNSSLEMIQCDFDGKPELLVERLDDSIRYFSTNSNLPEGKYDHLRYQNSINFLFIMRDLLKSLE